MTARTVLILLALAGLAVAGAVRAVLLSPGPQAVAGDAVAFPVLRASLDRVARLSMVTAEGTLDFVRQPAGAGWTAVGKHGHPASAERIRDVVATLADMRLVEAKTAMPERFARIGVQAPDRPGATSALLRLEDAAGAPLAAVILGRRVWRRTGPARDGTFVRLPDQTQAWLASGGTDLPSDLIDWLDQSIVDIEADAVARVAAAGGSGAGYVIARQAVEDDFVLLSGAGEAQGGTAGPEPVDPERARALSTGFARLRFDDVAPHDGTPLPGETVAVTVTTFDGLAVTVTLATGDKPSWARVSATGAGAAAAARAAAINERTAPWRYLLADWRRDRLAVTLDALKARPAGKG